MLITEVKSKDTIKSLIKGNVFILNCYGCKEVHFPVEDAKALQAELFGEGIVTGILTLDYICNPAHMLHRLDKYRGEIAAAETLLVFSCGVGVQNVSGHYPDKRVIACCDTYPLPGFQGVTPQEVECGQCGQCYLNLTGGICPITACSKSLINGQCGGSKNGMCEVDPDMECGWERIYRRLSELGRLDVLKCPVQLRDYGNEEKKL